MRLTLSILLFALTAAPSIAEESHSHSSKYAGEEAREIKSLSNDDIAELRRGGGWGLAKAAELNGIPGPAHLLELQGEIPLNAAQVNAITALRDRMRAQAIAEGEVLIGLERELEHGFRQGNVTAESLRQMLEGIAASRARLRFIHLSTHLETPKILTAHQIKRYNSLRGYDGDPCANVPEGHNEDMWKKHNGCE